MPHLHTNSLIHETSPYLLQHAHNPVQWHAWSSEALKKAKEQQKPVLVSIGYAACHWCHVMERESFEDEVVAAFMNEHFINIKIDREERPDIDHMYMDAVQAMTGGGGWPLNVFINPEGKPFYGGTYFPPQKAFNRPSWMDVLIAISDAWENRREDLEAQAIQLTTQLENTGNIFSSAKLLEKLTVYENVPDELTCKTIAENLLKNGDNLEGGFGQAPKFPQTFSILFLLQHAHFFGNIQAQAHAELSLQKMLNGGIYDQLGGGLSRYSTDNFWLAPHFEKMLYDNALFITVLCDAWQLTRNAIYLNAINTTIRFINAEMRDEMGGYYAALDADSEGKEGKFYVWQQEEINELLGDNAALFSAFYNITPGGNWEHENILHIKSPANEIAAEFGIEINEFTTIIDSCKGILLNARRKRTRPQTDDKILLSWNALLLTAFCKAYACSGNENYKKAAEDLFAFIEQCFMGKEKGAMYHTYKNGKAKYPAFLDDYAFLIEAAIYLQEISANQDYLLKARTWLDYVEANFSADTGPLFYFTGIFQEDIVVRKQEIYDGALPSSNAVMAKNLLYLGRIYSEKAWLDKGQEMIIAMKEMVEKYPGSFAVWAQIIQQEIISVNEIVVTGLDPFPLLKEVLDIYIPNRLLQSHQEEAEFPLLKNKDYGALSKIYICKNYQCQVPVTTKDGLIDALKRGN